ncbi:MAG: thioesterase [Prolixibacteraceae bacterium]|jgi:acyl-ACP thioesterase|nr:thioesterase [Prolixibacteraceae bacterium]
MRYRKDFTIHSYETNRFGKASLASVFNFLIEIAWEHAQTLDWGFDALRSNHLFWVLSRIYIQAEEYPEWQEKITIETWPTGTEGIYAFREYAIKNEQGKIIISASSAWLILDLESKRIIRSDSLTNNFQKFAQERICRYPAKIKTNGKSGNLVFTPANFTDIDINQHFNSVRFVERALNFFGIDFLNKHKVNEIEVSYLKEGMPEDSIAVSRVPVSENEDMISLIREADRTDLCIMKIKWIPR